MKNAIVASAVLAFAAAALGQGHIQIDSLIGAVLVPILKEDGSVLVSGFAQVYRYDANQPGGIGATVGKPGAISSTGRFRNQGTTVIDGIGVQQQVALIVRAWDGGPTYDTAALRGTSADWLSKPLGGVDPDGASPWIPPKLDGFATFTVKSVGVPGLTANTPNGSGVVPEPSAIALGVLGTAAMVIRLRRAPMPALA